MGTVENFTNSTTGGPVYIHVQDGTGKGWASKKTMLAAGGLGGWGGACRSATGGHGQG